MKRMVTPRVAWPVLMIFLVVTCLACAANRHPRPKAQITPQQYPNFKDFDGLGVAVVPFDGTQDVYSDPQDPKPAKPDFNWLKSGVRPTRIIMANDSQEAVFLDPSQISMVDDQGVSYQAYSPQEAGESVVSSEAFRAYLRGALRGALLGGAIGAGLGAALGAVSHGRGYYYSGRGAGWGAAQGAAWGGAIGGAQGLFVGGATSRADLERRVRTLINTQQLREKVLSPGMTHEGLVFFPPGPITAVRLVLADKSRKFSRILKIPVSLPPPPVQDSETAEESKTPPSKP